MLVPYSKINQIKNVYADISKISDVMVACHRPVYILSPALCKHAMFDWSHRL